MSAVKTFNNQVEVTPELQALEEDAFDALNLLQNTVKESVVGEPPSPSTRSFMVVSVEESKDRALFSAMILAPGVDVTQFSREDALFKLPLTTTIALRFKDYVVDADMAQTVAFIVELRALADEYGPEVRKAFMESESKTDFQERVRQIKLDRMIEDEE